MNWTSINASTDSDPTQSACVKKIDKHRQKILPNILVTNIRSIGQKLDELFCVIRNYNVHILRNDLYCVEWGVKLYSLTHRNVAQ